MNTDNMDNIPNNDGERPEWWQKMLTRRSAAKSLAGLAAMAGVSGFLSSCDDDDDVESDAVTLELQQKEGWNVGSTEKKLTFPDKQDKDSMNNADWRAFAKPEALMKAWQPAGEWQPYYVPTLIQSLAQPTLQNAVVPVCSAAMREAYSRGLGMRQLIKESKNPVETVVFADISGPEAVAFAAAVADVAVPVLTFDNWPHPLGVVPSHLTLSALVYFAREVAEKAAKRPQNAPAVFVLDDNRLAKYTDADNQFDNRYMAKVPGAEKLVEKNIKSALYAAPNETRQTELDDLNDDFAVYQEKNIKVEMLPVTRFQAVPSAAASGNVAGTGTTATTLVAAQQAVQPHNTGQQNLQQQNMQGGQPLQNQQQYYGNTSGSYVGYAPVYYYGGSPFHSPWFFYHYPVYTYYRPMPSMTRLPSTTYSRPAYSAVRRPTMFSASRVGGASSGIGKQRPTGFGRVAVRTSSTTGRVSGIRAGRSGSFGSSRSGSFGRSSFGGRSS